MTHRKDLSDEMLKHIACQRKSGLSIANYAKQIGITTTKLQYWIRKFNRQEDRKDINLKFIDLNSFDTVPESGNPQITLTFPNGMCLKIY